MTLIQRVSKEAANFKTTKINIAMCLFSTELQKGGKECRGYVRVGLYVILSRVFSVNIAINP